MRRKSYTILMVIFLTAVTTIPANSQSQTVGMFFNNPGSMAGYTLFNTMIYETAYLINNEGLQVNSWTSNYGPALSLYLTEDGNLMRTGNPLLPSPFNGGGAGGIIEEFDWDGNLVWDYSYISDDFRQHHDIEILPNGNILLIAWEWKSNAEAIEAGIDPAALAGKPIWPDHIVEVLPLGVFGGTIVWEWHAWDHMIQDFDPLKTNYGVVEDHPELLDANYEAAGGNDWMHVNAIDYNEDLDQIVISVPNWNEFWVIDHSTTSEEAAGHTGGNSGMGGDILYRWGNPEAYRAGTDDDQQLWDQHNVQWIEDGSPGAGHFLIFNNGDGRPGTDYSTIDQVVPPVDGAGNYTLEPDTAFGPTAPLWQFVADNPGDFYSSFISGAQRLRNGNTLVCNGGSGSFFEVNQQGDSLWLYINPVTWLGPIEQGQNPFGNSTFRAERYYADFPGFVGKDLTPGDPIEIYPDIPCSDIQDLRARCQPGGTLQAMVRFTDNSHDNEEVKFVVDGFSQYVEPINNGRATLSISGFPVGSHTVELVDPAGCVSPVTVECTSDETDGISLSQSESLPSTTELLGNYPNPFNPTTTIRYQLSDDAKVNLRIYNVSGQLVKSLVAGYQSGGTYDIAWDGRSDSGEAVASGTYIYRMQVEQFDGTYTQTKRMVLIR